MAGRLGREVYATREWSLLRMEKLRSTNWRCEQCGKYAKQAHHVVPLHAGGPALPPLSGLRVLCPVCHCGAHKSARQKAWRKIISRVRNETHASEH